MMRTALILGSVGTLVAMQFAAHPRAANAIDELPVAQTSVGISGSYDTLTNADRLEPYRYAQSEAPTPPASSVEPRPAVSPAPITPQELQKSASRHSHSTDKRKVAVALPKPRPKTPSSEKHSKADRLRDIPVVHKRCQQNAFDSFLKALSLSSSCEA
jgi:hypothetical protein